MDHAQPIDRDFSWRAATPMLALLLLIALVALIGAALLHRPGGTRPVSDTGHGQNGQATVRPRSATAVLVLNGNGIAGAAGGVSTRLLAHGYRSAPAMNAQVTTYARSVVLYRPGSQNEARRLAKDAHIGAIAPLDGALPAASHFRLVLIVGH